MAILQPLFQQNDSSDQTALVTRLLIRDLVNERHGLIQDTAFAITQRAAGANNSVDVAAGGVIIPGNETGVQGYYYVVNDAVINLPMGTAAHATLPRIDTIIVRVRDSFYSGGSNDAEVVWVSGTAASTPSAPNIDALGYKNYYRLANVSVPANDNTITNSDITDQRLVSTQGRATALGGIIVCTSGTRPANPRTGQMIFETDVKRLTINEGTAAIPSWITYAVPGSGSWTNYTPTLSNVTLGTGGTRYGRYWRMGALVVGNAGFTLGTSGNVTGGIQISLPPTFPAANVTNVNYMCVGRGHDVSAGVYWSCTAQIQPSFNTLLMFNFATAGQAAWNATVPFDWTTSDALHILFVYETSA